MEFTNPYSTAPPPYSRLEEDSNRNSERLPANGPPTPAQAEGKDAVVTISIEKEDASSPLRKKGCAKSCILNSFLCGCSLRTGCIFIAVMYAISSAFFGIGVVFYFVLAQMGNIKIPFPPLMGINVAIYDATICIFVVIFLSIGIRKEKWTFLHVAKWLMILDLVLNALEEIILISIGAVYPFLINLVIQTIPIYFMVTVHSYENKLKTDEKKPYSENTEASFSNE